jgi:hypothetical protein
MLNYNSNVKGQTFSFVDLAGHPDIGVSRIDLLERFPMFKSFMELHKCSADELCAITYELGIMDKDLFEYTTYYYKECVLVAKDGVYKDKEVKEGYNYRRVREYADVYICQNKYANLRLSDVAKELIKRRFPFLMEKPFVVRTRRFDETINKLPNNLLVNVNDLDSMILLSNKITIGDLIKLYTDPGYKNSWIDKPIWNIYNDSKNIYFDTDGYHDGNSVSVPIDALYNKDWEAVENVKINGVPLRDKDGKIIPKKWFNGLQKDAPYMSSKVAIELKKYFT